MDILVMVGQLILALSILVILHELGHFLAARAFGIKVEKFYLFFDAWDIKLFKFNYKGVEYGIGWLPLGGYVKIAGMIDESMDTDQMSGPPQPWEFRSKPAWQRLIVMLGGIIVNIILGIFIFWMMALRYGDSYIPNDSLKNGVIPGSIGKEIGIKAGDRLVAIGDEKIKRFPQDVLNSKVLLSNSEMTLLRGQETVKITIPATILNDVADEGIDQFIQPFPRARFMVDSVPAGSNAQKAGIQRGDSIISIAGKNVAFVDEMQDELKLHKNQSVTVGVKRNNELSELTAQVSAEGTIGVHLKTEQPAIATETYGFFEALPIGTAKALGSFRDNAKGIGKIFTGEVKAQKTISSPVGIARLFGDTFDVVRFWSMVGLLSMALALMNLLPIPALDGGHAMFLIIEMIKGKPLSDKFMEKAQIAGFCILIALMVFAFGNDIFKILTQKN
jgi:regulator of sigma E protease